MTTVLKACASVLLITIFATLAPGRNAFRSNIDEVEELIKASKTLEQNPLGKDAKEVRSEALMWVIQTDKVTVQACSLLVSGLDKKYKYSGELTGQYAIAMAAFKLANPEKAGDENAVQQAGIESALISYENMVKEQPKARNAFMDSLVAKRGDGSLVNYVNENNCRKN